MDQPVTSPLGLCPMGEGTASAGSPSTLAAQPWGTRWTVLLQTDSDTERVNNRLDHHAQEVITTFSVQKWKTALNAGGCSWFSFVQCFH